jgi:hypothetical protein
VTAVVSNGGCLTFIEPLRAHMSLLVASTYDQPDREAELLTLFENRRLEGVIASPSVEGVLRGWPSSTRG